MSVLFWNVAPLTTQNSLPQKSSETCNLYNKLLKPDFQLLINYNDMKHPQATLQTVPRRGINYKIIGTQTFSSDQNNATYKKNYA